METKARRLQRAEKEIREVISTYLMREQSGSNSDLVAVTHVVVSPDLRQAKAFVCIIGKDKVNEETLEILQSHAPEIQKQFAAKFRMKYCPKIQFLNDPGVKMLAKIDEVIKQDTKS